MTYMNKGIGVYKIAEILNKKGILTPTKYKQSKGLKFKNQGKNIEYWTESTVTKILKNEIYIGNMVQGYNRKISYKSKKTRNLPKSERIIVENTHKPIITKEQFYKVQELFNTKVRRCKDGEKHVFASKLVCKDCKMKLHKCRNDRGYEYFSCKGAKKLYGTCTTHSIGYEKLKKIITEKIREKIMTYYNFDNVSKDLFVINDRTIRLKKLERAKENIYKEIDNINKAIKELYINKVNGKISEDIFDDLNKSFLSDKTLKQNALSEIEEEYNNIKIKTQNSKYLDECKEKIINRFKDFKEIDYDIVDSFIDYIEIGEKKKCQDVIIHWNF